MLVDTHLRCNSITLPFPNIKYRNLTSVDTELAYILFFMFSIYNYIALLDQQAFFFCILDSNKPEFTIDLSDSPLLALSPSSSSVLALWLTPKGTATYFWFLTYSLWIAAATENMMQPADGRDTFLCQNKIVTYVSSDCSTVEVYHPKRRLSGRCLQHFSPTEN